eukprot:380072-Amphidinium_carterae.1
MIDRFQKLLYRVRKLIFHLKDLPRATAKPATTPFSPSDKQQQQQSNPSSLKYYQGAASLPCPTIYQDAVNKQYGTKGTSGGRSSPMSFTLFARSCKSVFKKARSISSK